MPRPPRIEPAGDVVARIAATALSLPDAHEEDAWTGVTEPTTVLTFRSSGEELLAEIVVESYRFCAPQQLSRQLDR